MKKKAQDDRIRSEIKETQKEIVELQDKLARRQKAFDNIKKEMDEGETTFLKQIVALEKDLRITQATYDSLNALHTTEVGKLAKYGN